MNQKIILSSYDARQQDSNNTLSNFTTRFDPPIELDRNKRYVFGLSRIDFMTYSWYNVSEQYKNKTIKYKLQGGAWKEITFVNGAYSYSDLNDYISEFLKVNDQLDPSPIKLEFDLTSFKVKLTLDDKVELDLTEGNFADLIGFEKKVVRETEYGTKIPDITNSVDSIHINCDLISNSRVGGQNTNNIYVFSTGNLTRSYPSEHEPFDVAYYDVNKNVIHRIRVYITDVRGRIIDLNQVDTGFTFTLKEL